MISCSNFVFLAIVEFAIAQVNITEGHSILIYHMAESHVPYIMTHKLRVIIYWLVSIRLVELQLS